MTTKHTKQKLTALNSQVTCIYMTVIVTQHSKEHFLGAPRSASCPIYLKLGTVYMGTVAQVLMTSCYSPMV